MPPETMTGVSASASSPTSTARRTISAALAPVAKLGETSAKTATSADDDERSSWRTRPPVKNG